MRYWFLTHQFLAKKKWIILEQVTTIYEVCDLFKKKKQNTAGLTLLLRLAWRIEVYFHREVVKRIRRKKMASESAGGIYSHPNTP